MPNLFGLDIAGIVDSAITAAGGLMPATLTVVTTGTRTVGNLSSGTNPTSTTHTCRGVVLDRVRGEVDVKRTASQVGILGASLPAGVDPKPLDRVTIESIAYVIERTERDAAGAMHVCHVKAA